MVKFLFSSILFFTVSLNAAYFNKVQITDNTNNAAITAPSVAPLATDPALVVAISPNSSVSVSLPPGSSTSALQVTGNSILSNIETNTAGLALQSGTNSFLDKVSTGAITALNDAVTINTNGASTFGVQILGTWSGVISLEGTKNGTDWYSISCFPHSGVGAVVSTTSGNTQLMCPVGASTQMRARRSTATSGTADVTVVANAGASIVQVYQGNANNLLTSASQSGTWNINNIAGTISLPTGASTSALQTTANTLLSDISGFVDGIETLLTSILAGANTFLDKSSIAANLTALNDAATINTNGTSSLGIQITGTWVGVVSIQGTKDGATWYAVQCFPHSGVGATVTTTSGNTQLMCPVGASTQMRAIRTTATSGTAIVSITANAGASILQVYQLNSNSLFTSAAQSGTWTVQPGNTPNTTPWYVQSKGSYSNITTATTTTMKSGAGVFKRWCINTFVNGSTFTFYDSTTGTGTQIAAYTTLVNGTIPTCFQFDAVFTTGLTVVTVGTSNITVVYE